MKGACPRCPQQNNMSDCGIYVLQYIESFFNHPIVNYSLPINSTAKWFSEQKISTKRDEIKHLMVSMQNIYNPAVVFDPEAHCRDIPAGSDDQRTDFDATG